MENFQSKIRDLDREEQVEEEHNKESARLLKIHLKNLSICKQQLNSVVNANVF